MRVLIIGNLGYIGPVVVKHFRSKYPRSFLAGYDIGYFLQNNTFNGIAGDALLNIQYFGDVRYFNGDILNGFDAVVYLAAISNDPMGNVFERPTLEINCKAAVEIAGKAKQAGVKHFVFASSCSVYGFADAAPRTEASEINPLTAYARSKVEGEKGLEAIADADFKVTCLRFATACGYSDRLRLDLVLNDFVASAVVVKKISILSDGSPWRPLIHVKDMAWAIDWAIHREHSTFFLIINTGSNAWNYQVKELAEAVQAVFKEVEISINANAQPDKRSYKVDFGLYEKLAPDHQPRMSLTDAVLDLKEGLDKMGFADRSFRDSDLVRLKSLQRLIEYGIVDQNLQIKYRI